MSEQDERQQTAVVRQEFNAVVESQFHETAASAIAERTRGGA
jgi:hypothetical protein